MRQLLALAALQLVLGSAHACLFVKDIPPGQWYDWASALFAGEVTRIGHEAGTVDVITVRVTETFKGPQGEAATLRVPSRMWGSCRVELPAPGARVLVAINPNNDTALVPLRADYADALRARRTNGAPGGSNGGQAAGQ
ncbi:MAG TPA: hypothetical protein VMN03_03235 [Burkholderiales bacterium]|nr:hypothetical protein [Burkholderiales bacterium]